MFYIIFNVYIFARISVEQTWICLNLILYPSSTNSITFCNMNVFGYVSLGSCQAKSSQTDRHRIKSYTFSIFQTSKLYSSETYPNTFMLQKVIELVDDGYKMRFKHIQVCSTGIRAYGNRN
jgi:hypothetical protein